MADENDTNAPQEQESHASTRMFQISEPDLAELEKCVPDLCERAMIRLDNNKSRVQIRKVKEIISNVRWNYGPWSHVTEIPVE